MIKEIERYFESKVEIPLIRHGNRQRLETLINEEVLMLAKFLRNESKKMGFKNCLWIYRNY